MKSAAVDIALTILVAFGLAAFAAVFSGCGAAAVGAYSVVQNRCLAIQHEIRDAEMDPELGVDGSIRRDETRLGAVRLVCDSVLSEIEAAVNDGRIR